MMTPVPYPNFVVSARCLSDRHLDESIAASRSVLTALQTGEGTVSSDCPSVRMWRGWNLSLMLYGDTLLREWRRRGHASDRPLLLSISDTHFPPHIADVPVPPWLGDERLHSSHRAWLMREDPEHYGRKGWAEMEWHELWWPAALEETT